MEYQLPSGTGESSHGGTTMAAIENFANMANAHLIALREAEEKKARARFWNQNLPLLVVGGLVGLYLITKKKG